VKLSRTGGEVETSQIWLKNLILEVEDMKKSGKIEKKEPVLENNPAILPCLC